MPVENADLDTATLNFFLSISRGKKQNMGFLKLNW